MVHIATPARGCFTAAYPKLAWRQSTCAAVPQAYPYAPRAGGTGSGPAAGNDSVTGGEADAHLGPSPQTVGNGVDFSASVTGLMNGATGSFPTVAGVTSETGAVSGSGSFANAYSLQLNTRPFTSPLCAGHPGCQGWEQFLYSSKTLGGVFIQYWLLNYNTACPAGWGAYSVHCYRNGTSFTAAPVQAITTLGSLKLSGTATGGVGGLDTAILDNGTNMYAASDPDNILTLSAGWTAVEFTLVGDCCSAQANFNGGSTVIAQTVVHNGTTNAPSCYFAGYTGETNNLTLVGTPALAIGASPYMQSRQSNVLTGAASCSAAAGNGDTHLRTYDGLYYDFQATGDFILSQSPNFLVENRQVSGAPNWPNAAVNSAVGTKMGADRVVLCGNPDRLLVNGANTALADGQTIILASGDRVTRTGNVYLVSDKSGNSVTVTMNGAYINAAVGLGAYPTNVSGLLANAPGNVHQFMTSSGQKIDVPIDFRTLYDVYGKSWRVDPSTSLLADCDRRAAVGVPTAPFWVTDLPTDLRLKAQQACTAVGVKDPTLFDACTLDVAELGNEKAAKDYVGQDAPVVVGFPPGKTQG